MSKLTQNWQFFMSALMWILLRSFSRFHLDTASPGLNGFEKNQYEANYTNPQESIQQTQVS